MAKEQLDVKVKVDDSELQKAKKTAQEVESMLKKLGAKQASVKAKVDGEEEIKKLTKDIENVKDKKATVKVSAQGAEEIKNLQSSMTNIPSIASRAQGALKTFSEFTSHLGTALNVASSQMQNLGNNMSMIGRAGLMISGVGAGAAVKGLSTITKSAFNTHMEIDQVRAQLEAQGLSAKKAGQMLEEMRGYANKTAFALTPLVQATSALNSQLDNIDESFRVTKVFGTALMASGKDLSAMQNIAFNLGQFKSGAFTKVDWKEALRNIPPLAKALRDIGAGPSWEDFTKAFGDNPNTKPIENAQNAYGVVVKAMDKWVKDTNAEEKANASFKAQVENFQDVFHQTLEQAADESGFFKITTKAINELGKVLENNQPLIQSYFKTLGKWMEYGVEKLKTIDFKKVISGFTSTIKSEWTAAKEAFHKYGFDKLLGDLVKPLSKGGDKGIGEGIAKFITGSLKLTGAGMGLKGLSSVTSLISAGTFLIGDFARTLSKVDLSKLGGMAKGLNSIAEIDGASRSSKLSGGLRNIGGTLGSLGGGAILFSTAIKTFKGLPSVPDIAAGFGKVAAVMYGFKLLDGIASKIRGKFSVDPIEEAISGFGSMAQAGSLMLFTKALQQLDKLPSNTDKIMAKFRSVFAAIAGMKGLNLGSSIVSKTMGFGQIETVVSSLGSLVDSGVIFAMSKALKELDGLPDIKTIQPKIGNILLVLTEFTAFDLAKGGATIASGVGGFATVIGQFSNILTAGEIASMATALKALSNLPERSTIQDGLDKLRATAVAFSDISIELGGGRSKTIGESFIKLVDNIGNTFRSGSIKSFVSAVTELGKLNKITMPTTDKLHDFGTAILEFRSAMPEGSVAEIFGNWVDNKYSEGIVKATGNMGTIITALNNLAKMNVPDTAKFTTFKTAITDMLSILDDLKPSFVSMDENGKATIPSTGEAYEFVSSEIETISESIGNTFKSLQDMQTKALDATGIIKNVKDTTEVMKETYKQLRTALVVETSVPAQTGPLGNTLLPSATGTTTVFDDGVLASISRAIDQIKPIVEKVGTLNETVGKLQDGVLNAEQVKQSLNQLWQSLNSILTSFQDKGNLATVDKLGADGITKAINSIQEFSTSVTNAIKNVANIQPQATTEGTNLAGALIKGFIDKMNPDTTMHDSIKLALGDMKLLGSKKATELKTGFTEGVKGLADQAVAEANRIKDALNGIPNSIFVSVNVNSNIDAINNSLDNLFAKAGQGLSASVRRATGGIVGYYAKGGKVGTSPFASLEKGTDKIPAMLTEGEYVHTRNATNFWGQGFMDAVNKQNIDRVSQLMQSRVGATRTYNTYNTYNNNNPVVNQTFSGNGSQQYLGLRKLVRGL